VKATVLGAPKASHNGHEGLHGANRVVHVLEGSALAPRVVARPLDHVLKRHVHHAGVDRAGPEATARNPTFSGQ
tara:strand:- start:477 stop:698 length:222 start_codon:yes stop_codon:yes gene_type:complete